MHSLNSSFVGFILFIICFIGQDVEVEAGAITSLCLGLNHGCAVADNKRVKCWGSLYSLGQSASTNVYIGGNQSDIGGNLPFFDVGSGIGVVQVSCGGKHTCFRLDTGLMKCAGDNTKGQIGLGTTANPIGAVNDYTGHDLLNVNLGTVSPNEIFSSILNVFDVALGQYHTCAKVTGNKVKCFGNNELGQLGVGDTTDRGTLQSHMNNNLQYTNLGTNVEVASLHSSSSSDHTCVIVSAPIANAQRIKCWGSSSFAVIGYGDSNNRGDEPYEMGDNLTYIDLGTESKVQQLSLGNGHTCALLVNNVLKCWGSAGYGQLGSGSFTTVLSMGNSLGSVLIDSATTVKYISTGFSHTCVVYADAVTMKCIGLNAKGQLGQGDKINRGGSQSSMIPSIPAIQLGTNSLTILSIHSGQQTNCVLFSDSTVKCFGANDNAQCFIGSLANVGDDSTEMGLSLQASKVFAPTQAPTKVPTRSPTKSPVPTSTPTSSPTRQRDVTSICSGQGFTCLTLADRRMKCWGLKASWGSAQTNSNDFLGDQISELGDASPFIDVGGNIGIIQVTCGGFHICMRLSSNEMKCLGNNNVGQVGVGVSTSPIGSFTNFIGNSLPSVNLGLASGNSSLFQKLRALAIALGQYHTCTVAYDGVVSKVKCYGGNFFGQLGLGDTGHRGAISSQMGDNLPFVDLGTNVEVASLHSSSTSDHTCAILSAPSTSAQRFKCWGYNSNYQLGYGDTNTRGTASTHMGESLLLVDLGVESKVKSLALGSQHTCALLITDVLKCWGSAASGQLGSGFTTSITGTGNAIPNVAIDNLRKISLLTAGEKYTCLVYDDMITMKCFGKNDKGQLGQSDINDRGGSVPTAIIFIPAIQLGTGLLKISSVGTGLDHNCIVFSDNTVKCFGNNSSGQLLIGSTNIIGDTPGEMGVNLQFSIVFTPTKTPTKNPTITPTRAPTQNPSKTPTRAPTQNPSKIPTRDPTVKPTSTPTMIPSIDPTSSPSKNPTPIPTTANPTTNPTKKPRRVPTKKPTNTPSRKPTKSPGNICTFTTKKKCKKDPRCRWLNQACSPL